MKQAEKIVKPKEISEYEMRVKAMTLATQHSKNCHSETLIKLAGVIYDFLIGKITKSTKERE